jgi:M6 family metalloprotease-like protein
MKKILLSLTLVFALVAPMSATAAVKAGGSCKKVGQTSTYAGKKFTCVKSRKKFVWNKGVAIAKPTPVVSPTPVATPTPTPTLEPTPTPTPSPTKVIDPTKPIQGQPCVRNSADVVGYNDKMELVALMCNQWDDRYFPSNNPAEIDQTTGKFKKAAMQRVVQLIEWVEPVVVKTMPTSSISATNSLANLSECKIPDAGAVGAMPSYSQQHFIAGFGLYPERAPLTRNPVIQFVTIDFPDLQGKRTPAEDLKEVTDFLGKYWSSQVTKPIKLDFRIPNNYIRMPLNVIDYKMNIDFFSPEWRPNTAFDYVREAVRIADPLIDFTNADVLVIAVPAEVTRNQIAAFIAESSEARFPNQGFQTKEKKMMNTLVMAGPRSHKDSELLNWAHELGHNFGFTDIRNTQDKAKQDSSDLGIYDLMNSAMAPELLAWNRFIVGALNDNQVRCVNSGTTTHLLRPVAMPINEEKMVVIPTGRFKAIAMESRRAIGFDAPMGTASEGVIVYEIDTTIPYNLSAMKLVPRVGSVDKEWRRDAALKVGDSISTQGWKITVVESGDFGDVVKVEKVG